MGVLNNTQGPVSPETSMSPSNELATLTSILMEIRIMNIILRQGFNITDEGAALRNSITVSDLQNNG